MLRTILFSAVAATLVTLLVSSQAQAWGGYHAGYTAVGPAGGSYHVGETAGYGPGGAYATRTVTATPPNTGSYVEPGHPIPYGTPVGGAAYGGYHYAPSYSGGYAAGGVRVGGAYVP